MINKLKSPFFGAILLSVLLYGIPFEFGGRPLRWGMGIALLLIFLWMLKVVFTDVEKAERVSIAAWLTNAIVILHLVLIFVSLMFQTIATLIAGLLLGSIVYLVVLRQIEQRI